MLKRKPSAGMIKPLNRRQRKKLRVGEFQELVFRVSIIFRQPLDETGYDRFWDHIIDLIESRNLAVGGLGGKLPLMEADGIIAAWECGSPSEADRQAVLDWLMQYPDVASAEAGDFVDGWYGWEDDR